MTLPARLDVAPFPDRRGLQKAARLMRALGPAASAVWAELSTEEADQLSVVMNATPANGQDEAGAESEALLTAFASRTTDTGTSSRPASVWSELSALDPAAIARSLDVEHPQIVAVVLSRLDPDIAAQTVRALHRDTATEALRRLLHLGRVRGEAIGVIESAMGDLIASGLGRTHGDGHETVARIFDQLDPRLEQGLLASIEQSEPGSGARIRAMMFTFDDLSTLNPAAIQTILARTDRAILAVALKGAKPAVRGTFLRNMTQRAGSLLVSDIEALGPTRRSEIETARQEITALARTLARRGDILAANDAEDELVE